MSLLKENSQYVYQTPTPNCITKKISFAGGLFEALNFSCFQDELFGFCRPWPARLVVK